MNEQIDQNTSVNDKSKENYLTRSLQYPRFY